MRSWVAALLALGVAVALPTYTGAGASAGPASTGGRTLSASTTENLADQVVQVSWTHFNPTTQISGKVIVVQCPEAPASLDACYTAPPFPAFQNGNEVVDGSTQADGTGSAFIEVRPAALLPQLDCSQTHPCALLAYENEVVPPGHLPTNYATVSVHFAASVADCPPITNYDVRLEGESSTAPAAYQWAAAKCTGSGSEIVDYTNTSSVLGREDFLSGIVDGAVTSLPATAAELAAVPHHPALAYAPVDLTAVVVAYNFRDVDTNQPITDLVLTPRLVARIITESDLGEFFSDPEFLRLNATHHWPVNGVSLPLLRAERNDDTTILTSWLASDSRAAAFLDGTDPEGIPVQPNYQGIKYPTDSFQNVAEDSGYVPQTGEYNTAIRAFYGVKPAETFRTDPRVSGAVAVLDLPSAESFKLPIAKIVNPAGVAVAPDATSIQAGFSAMKVNADGTRVPNVATTNPAAYPLVKVDHVMLSPAERSAALAASTKSFLDYAVTAGQTGLPAGYFPLPGALVTQTESVAASLHGPAVPSTTTTTTAPTTTTTLAPLESSLGGTCCSSTGDPSGSGPTVTTPATASATTPTTVAAKATPTLKAAKTSATLAAAGARLALPFVLLVALLALAGGSSGYVRPGLERARSWWAARKATRTVAGADGVAS